MAANSNHKMREALEEVDWELKSYCYEENKTLDDRFFNDPPDYTCFRDSLLKISRLVNSALSAPPEPVGNGAEMREALKALVRVIDECDHSSPLWWHDGAKGVEPLRRARAALSAPARNCDRFDDELDAWHAFSENHGGADASLEEYELWLFAEAKGEDNGSK